jgi:hypothetical protein
MKMRVNRQGVVMKTTMDAGGVGEYRADAEWIVAAS